MNSNTQEIFDILFDLCSKDGFTLQDVCDEFKENIGISHEYKTGKIYIEFAYSQRDSDELKYICISHYDENDIKVQSQRYTIENIRDGMHFDF